MMVTFISQCEKKALNKTRRVLDAFANRIGDNAWQTVITEDGLQTVKQMLRRTASKNTAVSCHWLRSRSRSQFLWVVGNRRKFDVVGNVPVNTTELNLSHKEWEQGWYKNEVILIAATIAGLFHDFGKANVLFQEKLKGAAEKSEPYRHEWVSLRLFEAFVNGQSDSSWLQALAAISENAVETEAQVIDRIHKDHQGYQNPFVNMEPFAQLVGLLVVSHHRLPLNTNKMPVDLSAMDQWLYRCFDAGWNSKNAQDNDVIPKERIERNWVFPQGTPFVSKTWQHAATDIAQRALNGLTLVGEQNWFEQRFVSHMARLSLMLADHYYSSLGSKESNTKWRDSAYKAFANTDRENKNALKQQLDEHNIGVAKNAQRFIRNLPALRETLPSLAGHRVFHARAPEKYRWQDKAFNKAQSVAKQTQAHGFFGINMASTGCGKTICNARIMYGLSDELDGCRFSVALGLRNLTLQTGDAYRKLISLSDSEMAVLIGSQAVKALHELNADTHNERPSSGSESEDDFFADMDISYEGQIYDGRLKRWLASNNKLNQLVSAPITVSTIDHLMPATESLRGGKQIAPMLRLLTSDLILDEPDDFGLEDLPALCRLVNWAGVLGSRVLLSSATLPMALAHTLFDAYREGRRHFNMANRGDKQEPLVVCGWFDEFGSTTSECADQDAFKNTHDAFVIKRIKKLAAVNHPLRRGSIVKLPVGGQGESDIQAQLLSPVVSSIYEQIHQLHTAHHLQSPCGKKVSLGVVRIANIEPMIALVETLAALSPKAGFHFHLCAYHSQFPLALRSFIESKLDASLTRYNEDDLWQQPEIQHALKSNSETNQVFIVIGTSVVEVGRDHDYDWAIAEPSSLRSIIQLAGRVQRHRKKEPKTTNFVVLNKNIRAVRGETVAYCKPGFETPDLPLASHDLSLLLDDELEDISAIPRIANPNEILKRKHYQLAEEGNTATKAESLFIQEHRALRIALDSLPNSLQRAYRSNKEASLWWKQHADWNGEYIKQTKFRASQPQEDFILRCIDGEQEWVQLDATHYPAVYTGKNNMFTDYTISCAESISWWISLDPVSIFENLAEKLDISVQRASERFGGVSLNANNEDLRWYWCPQVGIFSGKYVANCK